MSREGKGRPDSSGGSEKESLVDLYCEGPVGVPGRWKGMIKGPAVGGGHLEGPQSRDGGAGQGNVGGQA